MGRIADQLNQLIKQMEESDRRLRYLVDEHVSQSTRALNLMEDILNDEEWPPGPQGPFLVPVNLSINIKALGRVGRVFIVCRWSPACIERCDC